MSPRAKTLPVDVYVRVSRVGGREHLISPEEQERDARSFAERRGLRVGEVFTDLDKSGGTLERPGLQAALERVRSGASAGIVVAYLSRLTRETSQGLSLLEEIREAGGDVYAPNLSDHTTADGRMLNTIQLAIDAGMRERAKEQIARARENAIANGIPVANRPPAGYLRDPETRRYVPDPDAAPVIREVFERRAAGAGPTALAELLEARGVRTSQGSATWSKPAVQGLIKSRTYLGEVRSGPYVNPSAHEPIVDEPTWLAAQHPNPAPKPGRAGHYLLSGILRCATCGYAMQGTHSSRGKRIYRCTRRHAGGVCPAPARVAADAVEALVLEKLRGMAFLERVAPEVDVAALSAAFEAADRRLQQVLGPDMQDALGDAWAGVVKERRLEREEAGRALGEAQARAADASEPQFRFLRTVLDGTADVELATAEKRALLKDVFPAIAVSRDKTLDFKPDVSRLPRAGYRRNPSLNPL